MPANSAYDINSYFEESIRNKAVQATLAHYEVVKQKVEKGEMDATDSEYMMATSEPRFRADFARSACFISKPTKKITNNLQKYFNKSDLKNMKYNFGQLIFLENDAVKSYDQFFDFAVKLHAMFSKALRSNGMISIDQEQYIKKIPSYIENPIASGFYSDYSAWSLGVKQKTEGTAALAFKPNHDGESNPAKLNTEYGFAPSG